jgi:hypothetical protein
MHTEQLVLWQGCIVGKERAAEMENWFAEKGFTVKYQCEYSTLQNAGEPDTGGRNDLIFSIQGDQIAEFALWRLQHGMRWWEDYLANGGNMITPKRILKKYPNGWAKHEKLIEGARL